MEYDFLTALTFAEAKKMFMILQTKIVCMDDVLGIVLNDGSGNMFIPIKYKDILITAMEADDEE